VIPQAFEPPRCAVEIAARIPGARLRVDLGVLLDPRVILLNRKKSGSGFHFVLALI
jgi:hypothetical protein